ncbi:alpha-endosulfine isoform X1 [Saccopteryx bilineata]|uniref:alpha-endosulfine isoform X1 n=1 Tax=Saccopteryx bilineata TaxID=59482 RepID=UPI00338EFEBB
MSQKQEEENPAEETGEEKQDTQEKEGILPERAEEAKLKAKYPSLGQKPGGSDFLMKRLQKGQKYFDSGDYNMAKAKMKNKQLPSAGPDKNLVTGDHIPTPQDLPQRKSSLVTSKLAGQDSIGVKLAGVLRTAPWPLPQALEWLCLQQSNDSDGQHRPLVGMPGGSWLARAGVCPTASSVLNSEKKKKRYTTYGKCH